MMYRNTHVFIVVAWACALFVVLVIMPTMATNIQALAGVEGLSYGAAMGAVLVALLIRRRHLIRSHHMIESVFLQALLGVVPCGVALTLADFVLRFAANPYSSDLPVISLGMLVTNGAVGALIGCVAAYTRDVGYGYVSERAPEPRL